MRADLLDAQAAIDWAKSQIEILAQRIITWLESRPYTVFSEYDPQRGKDALKICQTEPLPLIVNAEAGAIINSIRSSLDILASALAARNGCVGAEDVYFPVCRTAESWRDSGLEKVKRLAEFDKATIEKLQPYHRGDNPKAPDPLFWLHQLDVMRKHRKLVEARPLIEKWNLTGWGLNAEFPPQGIPALKDKAILAWVSSGATNYKHAISTEIVLCDAAGFPRAILTNALVKFGDTAQSIIKLFDTP